MTNWLIINKLLFKIRLIRLHTVAENKIYLLIKIWFMSNT